MAGETILLNGSFARAGRDGLASHFTLVELEPGADVGTALSTHGAAVKGIAMGGGDRLSPEMLDAMPGLEIVSCYGVGYDGVDAKGLAERGIVVTHTPDVLNDEVANTAIALLLATDRRVVAQDRYVREGRWEREGSAPLTRGLAGRTVGIVGLGRIGRTIADKLTAAFGCTVVYHSRRPAEAPYRHYPDLVEMARACDVLIIVTPGGAATRHLVDRAVIEALGPDGTLVNVSRGTVVDEAALVAALADGRLGAAGLDVFEDEPRVPSALFDMENVVLLPHVGSATRETRQAMADLMVNNLKSWFERGRALTPVPECRHLNERR